MALFEMKPISELVFQREESNASSTKSVQHTIRVFSFQYGAVRKLNVNLV
jgi:hypothetical protein